LCTRERSEEADQIAEEEAEQRAGGGQSHGQLGVLFAAAAGHCGENDRAQAEDDRDEEDGYGGQDERGDTEALAG
jgi:hypothetical protein